MTAVLNVVFPVFGLIGLGWIAGRWRVLGAASSEALNRFVYYFALPALLFVGMTRVPIAQVFNGAFIASVLGGVGLTALVVIMVWGLALRAGLSQLSLAGLAAVFANTGYMGIPLFVTIQGPLGTLPAVIATVVNSALVIGLAMVLIEYERGRARGTMDIAGTLSAVLFKNPLVTAPLLGLAFAQVGLALPSGVANFGDLLAAAAGPCALFALGLFLATRPPNPILDGARTREVAMLVALKLVVHPLATWLVARAIGLDPAWTGAAVILAALPTGALVFVVASQYGVFVERTSSVILISTLASVVSLSLVLSYFAMP